MPRRCAMNSSGSTVVLVSISTMSMATIQISRGFIVSVEIITHTYSRNVSHHDSPQWVCESRFRMLDEDHSGYDWPYARSTFSKTKLTRSFLRSRMRTVGSCSSWVCIVIDANKIKRGSKSLSTRPQNWIVQLTDPCHSDHRLPSHLGMTHESCPQFFNPVDFSDTESPSSPTSRRSRYRRQDCADKHTFVPAVRLLELR